MSPENSNDLPEYDTKLTLGLPGSGESTESLAKSGTKRGFLETIDLNHHQDDHDALPSTNAKEQVVGWPPVRAFRKNAMKSCCKYVKVAVDGAPYLRKVDLEIYSSYQQLLSSLEHMFSCFTIRNYLNERMIMDHGNGVEYVPTYEDKDGDWMLVGDVPWKMFVQSCNRIRLMKSSEAIVLAPAKDSSTS